MSASFLSENLTWIGILIAIPIGLVIFFFLRILHKAAWNGIARLTNSISSLIRSLKRGMKNALSLLWTTAKYGTGVVAILSLVLVIFVQYFFVPLVIILLLIIIF